jgi:hypothetical protein
MSASTSPGRRVTPTWVGPGQHCEWRTGQGEVRPLRGAVVTELGDWRVEIDGSTCVDRVQVAAASSEWSSRCRDVDGGCEEGGVHGVAMYGMASRDESVTQTAGGKFGSAATKHLVPAAQGRHGPLPTLLAPRAA